MADTMLPGQGTFPADIVIEQQPGKTYKLERDRICGMTDGLDAVRQAVMLMLSTERYEYPIYSRDYGVEFTDLYGMPSDYVMSEVKRRIAEALRQDNRIESVDQFDFEQEKGKMSVSFVVHTICGDTDAETEVSL